MKKIILVTQEIEVTIPDDKIDEYMAGFNDIISDTDDVNELLNHIAWSVSMGFSFVEGVGRVRVDGVDEGYGDDNEFKALDIEVREVDSYCEPF